MWYRGTLAQAKPSSIQIEFQCPYPHIKDFWQNFEPNPPLAPEEAKDSETDGGEEEIDEG